MPSHRSAALMYTFLAVALLACGGNKASTTLIWVPEHVADVVGVEVAGEAGAYRFNVTVASPDSGCTRYADWWEVLSTDGELLYRRVLLHSHTGEQPFTRNGSPIAAAADQSVWVRAHMHPDGYGGRAMKGTPGGTFAAQELAPDFAADVADEEPLPTNCAF